MEAAHAPDLSQWSVAQLQQLLQENGIDTSSCTEKSELIALAQTHGLPSQAITIYTPDEENLPNPLAGMSYYEILNVEPTATANEIKRAYYRQALLWHPDKNKSPEAAEKFKFISEAYQVLSDESLRERYDRFGKEGLEPQGGFARAEDLFAFLFGGGQFKDFLGDFALADLLDGLSREASDEPTEPSQDVLLEVFSSDGELRKKR